MNDDDHGILFLIAWGVTMLGAGLQFGAGAILMVVGIPIMIMIMIMAKKERDAKVNPEGEKPNE